MLLNAASSGRHIVARLLVVAMSGLGGLGVVTLSTAAASAPGTPQLALHPNDMTTKPGDGASTAAVGWASSNWSGYAVTARAPFKSITGRWKVPSVKSTVHATFSAAWAGIDGFTNNSLIQAGTEHDYYNGAAHYAAWWTTSAQGFLEQRINEPVSPGDPMVASISGTGTSWTITLADHSAAHTWTFTKGPFTYTGPGASAEWILEAPTVGGRIANLAHYSSPTAFDPGTANGVAPNLQASDGGEMVQGRAVVSIPSVPDTLRDGFNISYGSVAPSPPPSS